MPLAWDGMGIETLIPVSHRLTPNVAPSCQSYIIPLRNTETTISPLLSMLP